MSQIIIALLIITSYCLVIGNIWLIWRSSFEWVKLCNAQHKARNAFDGETTPTRIPSWMQSFRVKSMVTSNTWGQISQRVHKSSMVLASSISTVSSTISTRKLTTGIRVGVVSPSNAFLSLCCALQSLTHSNELRHMSQMLPMTRQ